MSGRVSLRAAGNGTGSRAQQSDLARGLGARMRAIVAPESRLSVQSLVQQAGGTPAIAREMVSREPGLKYRSALRRVQRWQRGDFVPNPANRQMLAAMAGQRGLRWTGAAFARRGELPRRGSYTVRVNGRIKISKDRRKREIRTSHSPAVAGKLLENPLSRWYIVMRGYGARDVTIETLDDLTLEYDPDAEGADDDDPGEEPDEPGDEEEEDYGEDEEEE